MSDGPLVLGIDGGGSRSEARLWVGTVPVARAEGAGLNPNHGTPERSLERLVALLAELRTRSSGPAGSRPPDAACVGLSGISHPASRDVVRKAFETAGLPGIGLRILVSDAELVLEAAFGAAAPSGVALVCGTGSIALARDASGRVRRAGGLGPERGDAGGGHWIGSEGVAAGIVDAPRDARARLATRAPAVVAAARAGDGRAVGILARGARDLGNLVREAARAAGLGPGFVVRASGGVARGAPEMLAMLADDLLAGDPPSRLGAVVEDPIAGALAIATRALAAGEGVPPGW